MHPIKGFMVIYTRLAKAAAGQYPAVVRFSKNSDGMCVREAASRRHLTIFLERFLHFHQKAANPQVCRPRNA